MREALHRLAEAGYVEIRRGRHGGAFVQASWGPESEARVQRTLATDWAAFEELFDLRRLIEPVIAATAAERHTPETSARSARRTRPTSTPRTTARRLAPPIRRCTSRSRRRRATATSSTSPSRSAPGSAWASRPSPTASRSAGAAKVQHGELVEAIVERRAGDAAAIARTHFSLTETALRELLGRVNGAG